MRLNTESKQKTETNSFYHRGIIIQFDVTGKPLFVAGIVFDITEKKETQLELEYTSKIMKSIRETDFAGRYGGEEVMVVFRNADILTALSVAERIRTAVQKNRFIDGLAITISGGVKQYKGEDLTDLIHSSDMNL